MEKIEKFKKRKIKNWRNIWKEFEEEKSRPVVLDTLWQPTDADTVEI